MNRINDPEVIHMTIDGLDCKIFPFSSDKIAYLLSPIDGYENQIRTIAHRHGVSIVVIAGMDWDDDLTPWPAPGVPSGSDAFKGLASEFLERLTTNMIPRVESLMKIASPPSRTLVGISLSGLFALWQWVECNIFDNIISVSGSFWYEDFTSWLSKTDIPTKTGTAYFSLGDKECHSPVPQFRTVAKNTAAVVAILKNKGIRTIFKSVPGNHYQFMIPRLELAFASIYSDT